MHPPQSPRIVLKIHMQYLPTQHDRDTWERLITTILCNDLYIMYIYIYILYITQLASDLNTRHHQAF